MSANVSNYVFRCRKRKSENYQNSDRLFVLKIPYNYNSPHKSVFVITQTLFFFVGFIPHPLKNFSPKGHKKSTIPFLLNVV